MKYLSTQMDSKFTDDIVFVCSFVSSFFFYDAVRVSWYSDDRNLLWSYAAFRAQMCKSNFEM